MEKKQMKVNPKKHAKKAKLVKGGQFLAGIAAAAIPFVLAINNKDIKKK